MCPKFWAMHVDPIMLIDAAAATFVLAQINMGAGTLSMYLDNQPYLLPKIEEILRFDVLAHICLTEIGHGFNTVGLETTAVALPGGGFDLHTPTPSAVKMFAPTSPCEIPSIGVVFARLIVGSIDCGLRRFVVPINNGLEMLPGVKAKVLPMRGGTNPVNHSLTSFDHVFLDETALLGFKIPPTGISQNVLWRGSAGSLAAGSTGIPALRRAAYIAGRYSQTRKFGQSTMITFRTQYTPILVALAQASVLVPFWKICTTLFSDLNVDPRIRHAYATIGKAVFIHHAQCANIELADRLGARGLWQSSDITPQHNALRGFAIAEGDILGLSIRQVSELLSERCILPTSSNPSSLLAQHETGLLGECRAIMERIDRPQKELFNRFILPRCEDVVRAIGHRMAYDAAVEAKLDPRITGLYEAAAVKLDSAWYISGASVSLADQRAMEDDALEAALPCLDQWLADTGVEDYVQVPILTPAHWEAFVAGL
ncbi:hypothetical protein C8R46DRAFT_939809, partial [Mycena filopes]